MFHVVTSGHNAVLPLSALFFPVAFHIENLFYMIYQNHKPLLENEFQFYKKEKY